MNEMLKIGRSWYPMVLAVVVGAACSTARADVMTYDVGGDTYVDSAASNQSKNFGGGTSLRVLVNATDGSLCHALVQMPSGMRSIPAGDVTDIKLFVRVNQNRLTDQGPARTVRLFPLTASFIEGAGAVPADGATWATHDGSGSWTTAGGDYDALHYVDAADNTVASGGWFSWNMTSLWNDALVRGNLLDNGAIFTLDDESNPGGSYMPRAVFYSSDSSIGYGPYFEVTTIPEPASFLLLASGLPLAWWIRRKRVSLAQESQR